jgi:hypothetical protein
MDSPFKDDLWDLLCTLQNDVSFRKLVTKWLASEYSMSDDMVNEFILTLQEICMDENFAGFDGEELDADFEEPLMTLLSIHKNQCG